MIDIDKIKMLTPHPKEAIVFFYDMEHIDYCQLDQIHKCIKEAFPENVVIGMPDRTSLESCSKDVLENIISMISEIIDKI